MFVRNGEPLDVAAVTRYVVCLLLGSIGAFQFNNQIFFCFALHFNHRQIEDECKKSKDIKGKFERLENEIMVSYHRSECVDKIKFCEPTPAFSASVNAKVIITSQAMFGANHLKPREFISNVILFGR
jgi:hypothetical protein